LFIWIKMEDKEKTTCSICETTNSKGWLGKGNGIYCNYCSKDINDFEWQPQKNCNIEFLAEVFFRRGRGEQISFEELHKEKSDLNFISFPELFKRLNTTSEVQKR